MSTGIEWTEETWNPVTGCTKVSSGCDHCYAERITERFHGPGSFERVVLHPDRLDKPLRWRKPRRVFVNSMSDLFHDDVPDEFLCRVFDTMALACRHTFQVLTKRHARMRSFVTRYLSGDFTDWSRGPLANTVDQPPPNVWLGVSVEDRRWVGIRIPALRETPAVVRFMSCEPLLGPLDRLDLDGIGWVIVGGESGAGARPMDPRWAVDIVRQCREAAVPVFVKQLGSRWGSGHHDISLFPPALQVREYPAARPSVPA